MHTERYDTKELDIVHLEKKLEDGYQNNQNTKKSQKLLSSNSEILQTQVGLENSTRNRISSEDSSVNLSKTPISFKRKQITFGNDHKNEKNENIEKSRYKDIKNKNNGKIPNTNTLMESESEDEKNIGTSKRRKSKKTHFHGKSWIFYFF